jgi:hypothetical protein
VAVITDTPTKDGKPVVGKPVVGKPVVGKPVALVRPIKKTVKKIDSLAATQQGDDLASAGSARDVTAHWVDTFRAVHGAEPPQQSVKRVAQAAKQLLDEGQQLEQVLLSAMDAASGGHANLASALTFGIAKNKAQARQAEPKGFVGIRDFLEGG